MDQDIKTALVTGSTGLLGSACVSLFKEKEWKVVGLDNNTRATLLGTPKKEPQLDIDIRNWVDIEDLFKEIKFDAVIHCAAQASHDWSKTDPRADFSINAGGTLNLLEATRLYSPDAVFVYVSTDKVYGDNMIVDDLVELKTRYHSDKPFNEMISLDRTMRTPFGVSKLTGDLYTQEYAKCYGMKTGVFRPGCITGRNHEGAELHGFLAYMVKCIKEGKTYKIFGHKGKQVRDQIHALDLASAFYAFIQDPIAGIVYNIGGGPQRSVSVLEAIKLFEDKLGKKAQVQYIDEPRQGDRIWDVHNVSKFREDYPEWSYTYNMNKIIENLCEK